MIRPIFVLLAALGALPRFAFADVNYTQRYLSSGQAISHVPESRVLFKPNARLEETWRHYGTNYLREQRLTLFAEKKEISMDMALKIYCVASLNAPVKSGGDKARVTVKDLGEETVLGFKARHYQIDIHYDYQHASADADRELRREVWTVPSTTLKAYPTTFVPPGGDEGVLGDTEAYYQAIQGLPIRDRVSAPSKDKPRQYQEVYSMEITSLSTKKLDDAYFKIPNDYREVTAAEYQKAQLELSHHRDNLFSK